MKDLHKIDPHMVAMHGSKEYIQRIIEDVRSSGSDGPRSHEEIEKEVYQVMQNYI